MELSVLHARAFEDNYIWLITSNENLDRPRPVIIVDPGDAEPVLAVLEQYNLAPVAVFCTHHHGDHVGDVDVIASRFGVPVYGPATESITGVTRPVAEGDSIEVPSLQASFRVLDVPGHTSGHVAYFGHGLLFPGDTLFSAGCGRLLGGTAEQLHDSLERLARLSGDTRVYCAHEYTRANLRFAHAVEPGNPAIGEAMEYCDRQLAQHRPSLPSTLSREKSFNPFLRTDQPAVQQAAAQHAGTPLNGSLEVFTVLRRWKDGYRG